MFNILLYFLVSLFAQWLDRLFFGLDLLNDRFLCLLILFSRLLRLLVLSRSLGGPFFDLFDLFLELSKGVQFILVLILVNLELLLVLLGGLLVLILVLLLLIGTKIVPLLSKNCRQLNIALIRVLLLQVFNLLLSEAEEGSEWFLGLLWKIQLLNLLLDCLLLFCIGGPLGAGLLLSGNLSVLLLVLPDLDFVLLLLLQVSVGVSLLFLIIQLGIQLSYDGDQLLVGLSGIALFNPLNHILLEPEVSIHWFFWWLDFLRHYKKTIIVFIF